MLGDVLREVRKRKGLTLAQAAGMIGVSAGYLSNLEKNRQEPSLSILKELSAKLDISLPMLLAQEREEEEAVIIRKEDRVRVKYRNLANTCEVLTPLEWRGMAPSEIQVMKMEVPGERKLCIGDLSTDEDECIYVQKGQLEYHYGGGKIPIREGGSLFIPKRTGHSVYNPSKETASILWIVKQNTGG